MANRLADRLTRGDIWVRALYMLLFLIAYGAAEILLTLLVIFQLLAILFTGKANEPLLSFGTNLSRYVYQILQFMTFNSEEKPFPFSDWPADDHGGSQWLEEPEITAEAATPAAAATAPPAAAAAPSAPAAPPPQPAATDTGSDQTPDR